MAFNFESPVGQIMNAYYGKNDHAIVIQSVAFAVLFYMSLTTYWSLFQINLGWQYKLAGPQLSAHSSLVFNAQYFSRLQFSLGYNFLMSLNLKSADKAAFSSLMQNITIVPLFGTSFTVYTPLIMIVVALITFTNLYARALRVFGFDHEDTIAVPLSFCSNTAIVLSPAENDLMAAGKKLIDSELRREAKQKGIVSKDDTLRLMESKSSSSSPERASHDVKETKTGKRGAYERVQNPITESSLQRQPLPYAPVVSTAKFVVKDADVDAYMEEFNFSTDFEVESDEEESNRKASGVQMTTTLIKDNENVYAGRYSDV
jgi:LMBR1-like membrane protein